MKGIDINERGYLVLPRDPDEFLRAVVHNTVLSLEQGSDALALIDVLNQLTAAFLQDYDREQEDEKTGNGRVH